MKEAALLFGPRRSLVGVISSPGPHPISNEYPAVIFLNAGIVHRVGPNRLYVKIARRLASAGIVSLRFDLSGIGDSPAQNKPTPFSEVVLEEAKAAMDLLSSQRNSRTFVLVGICSGADHAVRIACNESAVIGAGLIDPYAVPTMGFYVSSYAKRLWRPRSWARALTGKTDLWRVLKGLYRRRKLLVEQEVDPADRYSRASSQENLIADLGSLLRRAVNVCLVYSSDGPAYYNYRTALRRRFCSLPSSEKLQIQLIRNSDHIFTLLEHQELLAEGLCEWALNLARGREESSSAGEVSAVARK